MAFRNIQAGMATYRGHGGDRGDAYYAHPTNAGPHPGVVVIHHMPGWDEWTCEVARKFAHHGYAAIAPSLYFRVGDGADEAVVTVAAVLRTSTSSVAGWPMCALARICSARAESPAPCR